MESLCDECNQKCGDLITGAVIVQCGERMIIYTSRLCD